MLPCQQPARLEGISGDGGCRGASIKAGRLHCCAQEQQHHQHHQGCRAAATRQRPCVADAHWRRLQGGGGTAMYSRG
jgi:hypothetical protein